MRMILTAALCVFFPSCAGYKLGAAKPPSLAAVKSISIPMFRNATLHPRAEALATSAVADALVSDGTYRLSNASSADAVLEGKIARIEYSTLRSSRFDSLVAEELNNTVHLEWVLRDARDPTKILASGSSVGQSSFYADSNLQTARQSALPDAFQRAGQTLVSTLSSGY